MNFDRNYQPQTRGNNTAKHLSSLQQISLAKRVYLYICLMTMVGAAMGEGKFRVESVDCMTKDECWTVTPVERRVRALGVGAFAGIFAASLISVPTLFQED